VPGGLRGRHLPLLDNRDVNDLAIYPARQSSRSLCDKSSEVLADNITLTVKVAYLEHTSLPERQYSLPTPEVLFSVVHQF